MNDEAILRDKQMLQRIVEIKRSLHTKRKVCANDINKVKIVIQTKQYLHSVEFKSNCRTKLHTVVAANCKLKLSIPNGHDCNHHHYAMPCQKFP